MSLDSRTHAGISATPFGIQKTVQPMPEEFERNPKRKIAYWIKNADEGSQIDPPYICSECGNAHSRVTPYCEMCGFKMAEKAISDTTSKIKVLKAINEWHEKVLNCERGNTIEDLIATIEDL